MGLRVLVADDHPDHVTMLEELLRSRGHQVDTTLDGVRALQLVRGMRAQSPYHLLIVDFMMSGLDGLQVAAAVRQDGDQVPIAMITAYGATAAALPAQARQHGICDIIDKPIDLARIDRVIALGEAYARTVVTAPANASHTGTVVRQPITTSFTRRYQSTTTTPPAAGEAALERKLGAPAPPPTPAARPGAKPGFGSGMYPMGGTVRTTRTPHPGSGFHVHTTTTRLRRGVGGTIDPGHQPLASPEQPPQGRTVLCAHCQRELVVLVKPQPYTIFCVHCGQANRIDP